MPRNSLLATREYFETADLNRDLKKLAVRGGGISIASRMSGYLINMVGVVVLARLLTPADFGLVAMVTVVTEFFNVFKDLGLSDATIQEPHIDHNQVSTLFWINIALGIFLLLCLIAISPAIAWFYKIPQLRDIAIISSISFLFTGLSTQHLALLKRRLSFLSVSIIDLSSAVISTGASILFAVLGFRYWAIVFRPLVQGLVLTIGAWIACPWRPGRPVRRSGIREMLKFGTHMLGSFFIGYLSSNVDKALIGKKYGASQLGFYNRAYHLSAVLTNQLSMSLFHVAVATLSKLRDEPEKFRRYFLNAISAISFIGMPLSAFMVLMRKEIVYLLLGPQWNQAATLFSILGLTAGIALIYATNGWLHVALGRADRWMKWNIVSSVIMVAGFFIGLSFGAIGVAIAYSVITTILTIPGLVYAGRPIGLRSREVLGTIWKHLSAAALSGLTCTYLSRFVTFVRGTFPNLLTNLLLFGAMYLSCTAILFRGLQPVRQLISLLKMLLGSFSNRTDNKISPEEPGR